MTANGSLLPPDGRYNRLSGPQSQAFIQVENAGPSHTNFASSIEIDPAAHVSPKNHVSTAIMPSMQQTKFLSQQSRVKTAGNGVNKRQRNFSQNLFNSSSKVGYQEIVR